MFIPFHQPLYEATFVERPNRFILHCRLRHSKEVVKVHLPDPGRLKEVLRDEATIYVQYSDKKDRKTSWSAVLAQDPDDGALISLQTTLANHLIEKALKDEMIEPFKSFLFKAREFTKGHSRWDFYVSKGNQHHLIEVKSVSLGYKGEGFFPDAVTKRGTKHVTELTSIIEENDWHGTILFVCQRNGLHSVRPAEHIDPSFTKALKNARDKGVHLLAYSTTITLEGIYLSEEVPVFI